MICEICGSQSIRKENGVFACQECGTEYSLDEAKKLLVDLDDEHQKSPMEQNNKSDINSRFSSIERTFRNGFSQLSLQIENMQLSMDKIVNELIHLSSVVEENNYALRQIMFDTRYSFIMFLV